MPRVSHMVATVLDDGLKRSQERKVVDDGLKRSQERKVVGDGLKRSQEKKVVGDGLKRSEERKESGDWGGPEYLYSQRPSHGGATRFRWPPHLISGSHARLRQRYGQSRTEPHKNAPNNLIGRRITHLYKSLLGTSLCRPQTKAGYSKCCKENAGSRQTKAWYSRYCNGNAGSRQTIIGHGCLSSRRCGIYSTVL